MSSSAEIKKSASQVRREEILNHLGEARDHGKVVLNELYAVVWSLINITVTGATEVYHIAKQSGVCKRK
jgi:hypothetical protein